MVVQFEDRRGNRSFHRRNGIKFVCVSRFSIPVLTKSNDDNNRQLENNLIGPERGQSNHLYAQERKVHPSTWSSKSDLRGIDPAIQKFRQGITPKQKRKEMKYFQPIPDQMSMSSLTGIQPRLDTTQIEVWSNYLDVRLDADRIQLGKYYPVDIVNVKMNAGDECRWWCCSSVSRNKHTTTTHTFTHTHTGTWKHWHSKPKHWMDNRQNKEYGRSIRILLFFHTANR